MLKLNFINDFKGYFLKIGDLKNFKALKTYKVTA